MSASDDERREELRARLPNVIRIAAGIVANSADVHVAQDADQVADAALNVVLACEAVCGIGGDDD